MTIDVIFLNGYKSGEFHCHTHAHQMYEKKFLNCLCAVAVWFPRVPPWKKRLLDMSGSRLSKKKPSCTGMHAAKLIYLFMSGMPCHMRDQIFMNMNIFCKFSGWLALFCDFCPLRNGPNLMRTGNMTAALPVFIGLPSLVLIANRILFC